LVGADRGADAVAGQIRFARPGQGPCAHRDGPVSRRLRQTGACCRSARFSRAPIWRSARSTRPSCSASAKRYGPSTAPDRIASRGDLLDTRPPMRVKKKAGYHHGDLRQTLIDVSVDVIARQGLDALSLRALATRAGVSSGAPAAGARAL